jgi:hypothetical protein
MKILFALGLLACPAFASWSYVASAGNNSGNSGVTIGYTGASGHLLIAGALVQYVGGCSFTISDTGSRTWTVLVPLSGASNTSGTAFWALANGSSGTLTLTPSCSGSGYDSVVVAEYANTGTIAQDGSSSAVRGATVPYSISGTNNTSGNLGIAIVGSNGSSGTATSTSGWTVRAADPNNVVNVVDNMSVSAGSVSVTISGPSGGYGLQSGIAFMKAVGGSKRRIVVVN